MSEPEKPLHVKVAEALGWTNLEFKAWYVNEDLSPAEPPRWVGSAPGGWGASGIPLNPLWKEMGDRPGWVEVWNVPNYDTDWSATGPLIEKYGIAIEPEDAEFVKKHPTSAWVAAHFAGPVLYGETPLIAVCNVLLVLSAAGKLKP